jgi:hypothetical protein
LFAWPRRRVVEGVAIAGMFGACAYTTAAIIHAHRNHARVSSSRRIRPFDR